MAEKQEGRRSRAEGERGNGVDSDNSGHSDSPEPLDATESSKSSFQSSSSGGSSDEEESNARRKVKKRSSGERRSNPNGKRSTGRNQLPKTSKKRNRVNRTENSVANDISRLDLTCDVDDLDLSLEGEVDNLPQVLKDKLGKIMEQTEPTEEQREKLKHLDIEVNNLHPDHKMLYGLWRSDIRGKPGMRNDKFDDEEIAQIEENWNKFCDAYGFDRVNDVMLFFPDPFKNWRDPRRALQGTQKLKFCQYISQNLPGRHPRAVYDKFYALKYCYRKGVFTEEENELIKAWHKYMPNSLSYSFLSRILHRPKKSIYFRWLKILGQKSLGSDSRYKKYQWALGDPETAEYPEWAADEAFWERIAAESKTDKNKLIKTYFGFVYPSARSKNKTVHCGDTFQKKVIQTLVDMNPKTWDDADWEKLGECYDIGLAGAYNIVRKVTRKYVPKEKWFNMQAVCDILYREYLLKKKKEKRKRTNIKRMKRLRKSSESSEDLGWSNENPDEAAPTQTGTSNIERGIQDVEIEDTGEADMEVTLEVRSNQLSSPNANNVQHVEEKGGATNQETRQSINRNLPSCVERNSHVLLDSDMEQDDVESDSLRNSKKPLESECPPDKLVARRGGNPEESPEELNESGGMKKNDDITKTAERVNSSQQDPEKKPNPDVQKVSPTEGMVLTKTRQQHKSEKSESNSESELHSEELIEVNQSDKRQKKRRTKKKENFAETEERVNSGQHDSGKLRNTDMQKVSPRIDLMLTKKRPQRKSEESESNSESELHSEELIEEGNESARKQKERRTKKSCWIVKLLEEFYVSKRRKNEDGEVFSSPEECVDSSPQGSKEMSTSGIERLSPSKGVVPKKKKLTGGTPVKHIATRYREFRRNGRTGKHGKRKRNVGEETAQREKWPKISLAFSRNSGGEWSVESALHCHTNRCSPTGGRSDGSLELRRTPPNSPQDRSDRSPSQGKSKYPKVMSPEKCGTVSRNSRQSGIESWLVKEYLKAKAAEEIEEEGTPPICVAQETNMNEPESVSSGNNRNDVGSVRVCGLVGPRNGCNEEPVGSDRPCLPTTELSPETGNSGPVSPTRNTQVEGNSTQMPNPHGKMVLDGERDVSKVAEDVPPRRRRMLRKRQENFGHGEPQSEMYPVNNSRTPAVTQPKAVGSLFSRQITPPLKRRSRNRPTNPLAQKRIKVVAIPARRC